MNIEALYYPILNNTSDVQYRGCYAVVVIVY